MHIKVVLQLRTNAEVFSSCIIFFTKCKDIKRERERQRGSEADKEKETNTKGPWKSAIAETYSKSHLTLFMARYFYIKYISAFAKK